MIDRKSLMPTRLVTRIFIFVLSVSLIFGILAILFWHGVMAPRLRSSEQTKLDLLIPLYAKSVVTTLTIQDADVRRAELDILVGEILIAVDPSTDKPLFEGMMVELTNGEKIVDKPPKAEFQGLTSQALLISPTNYNPIGTLRLYFSDRFLKHILESAKTNLLQWILVCFVILAIFLRLLIRQIRPLIELSTALRGFNSKSSRQCLPTLPPSTSLEIRQVKMAMDTLLADLTSTKEYVESIIASMTDTLLVISPHSVIKSINQDDLFGFGKNEVIGQPIERFIAEQPPGEVSREVSGDVLRCSNTWLKDLLQAGSVGSLETTLRGKDGQPVQVLISGSVMRDMEHTISDIVIIIKDISEFKKSQQAVLHAKEAQVLAAELANRTKGEFLANMSHEIRTPMNAIIGLNDLALKQDLHPKVRDYLIKIRSASQSLLRIINDILDFSKIESGKLVLEYAPFHLGDLFDHLSDLFRNQPSDKNIELLMEIARDCPLSLFGDALRLEQILINLISNALKFTEQGVVHVRANGIKAESHPDESVNAGRVELELTVRDSGIGLTSEQIDRLFHPFIQADGSTTRKYGGTGLGLSICKRLVELMGGRIGVESHVGEGSLFHFTIVCEQRPNLERDLPLPPEPLRGLKVLVVDDNQTALGILDAALRRFTFTPTLVSSGTEAVTTLEQALTDGTPYPLVCLDDQMPWMDGIETARKIMAIARQKTHDGLPKMILMTAFGREERLSPLIREAGISVLLSKPINHSQLFDTIMELFGQQVARLYRHRVDETDYGEIIDRIGGTRLLLVEDMPINQQVAQELLAGVGILVDVANNGAEAVLMVELGHYDAVLMDIQMPVMDGYEATQAIRRDPRFAALPIIAMTAHAMASDQERSRAAGMNDHIGKPIDPDRLFSLLMTYIPPGHRAQTS
ncbi:two-component system, sensor histidine kinase and response regulator [Gammaproteobacteria bacterium]